MATMMVMGNDNGNDNCNGNGHGNRNDIVTVMGMVTAMAMVHFLPQK